MHGKNLLLKKIPFFFNANKLREERREREEERERDSVCKDEKKEDREEKKRERERKVFILCCWGIT